MNTFFKCVLSSFKLVAVYYCVMALLALSSCGQGATGNPGQSIVGPKGDQGDSGADGQDGSDGVDAAPVTVVKLCPGNTVYPSKFVEIAFCVQGNLYGTYSANGGFSTEFPPGNYSSNAVGSSCNFSVLPNCVVN